MRKARISHGLLLATLPLLLAGALACAASGATLLVGDAAGCEYESIGAALAVAASGDTILVASGIYSGPENRGLDFEDRDITLVSMEGPSATIIDCEGLDRALEFHLYARSTAVVDGFTIKNGSADFGGGIYCVFAAPEIRNCRIKDCTAASAGGAIRYSETPGGILENCEIHHNSSVRGGAISALDSGIDIRDCAVEYNVAEHGGGLHVSSEETVTLDGCAMRWNEASVQGGSVYVNTSGSFVARGTRFARSAAEEGGSYPSFGAGGGVCAIGGSVVMEDCEFIYNSTPARAGGLYVHADAWEIVSCHFEGNAARTEGALWVYPQTPESTGTVSGCVFLENDATYGTAAAEIRQSDVTYCVFHRNWAGSNCSGLKEYYCHVRNCTFTLNASATGQANIGGERGTIEYCVIAFAQAGDAFGFSSYYLPTVIGCVIYANAGGIGTEFADVRWFDPKFCDVYGADVSLCWNSRCRPDAPDNQYGVLLGALDAGCGNCNAPVEPMSWGAIKALYR